MKKILIPLLMLVIIMMTAGCSSYRKIAYFQNIDSISLAASRGLYDARVMPKDELTITVNTVNPEASEPFNLQVRNQLSTNRSISNSTGGMLQGYLVDNDGNINFPVVGKLHVVGLTKREVEELVASKIRPYLAESENPIVTCRMSSFRVTVIGELGSSKVVPVTTEKMSIIEAIATAGDMSIYGVRDNVLLIREDATGEKHSYRLNFNDANLINSPLYYVQQNDIIYVQPNDIKARNSTIGTSTSLLITCLSVLTSVASLIVNIVN